MYLRDILSVMGEQHRLGDFPWGINVTQVVNPLLPVTATPLTLNSTRDEINNLMMSLPATTWAMIKDTAILCQGTPQGPPVAPQQPPPPDYTNPPMGWQNGGQGAPVGPTPVLGGAPVVADSDDPKTNRFRSVVAWICFAVTLWSMHTAWTMRHDNPHAANSSSIIVKLLQQIADTIDSAATGQPEQLPVPPGTPVPAAASSTK